MRLPEVKVRLGVLHVLTSLLPVMRSSCHWMLSWLHPRFVFLCRRPGVACLSELEACGCFEDESSVVVNHGRRRNCSAVFGCRKFAMVATRLIQHRRKMTSGWPKDLLELITLLYSRGILRCSSCSASEVGATSRSSLYEYTYKYIYITKFKFPITSFVNR